MAEFEILSVSESVDFAPNSETAEIIQNVRTLISTKKGDVPLDRDFGLDQEFIDKPLPVAQAMLSTEVIQKIKKYEPRAKVIRVGFANDADAADGQLRPRVVIGVNQ